MASISNNNVPSLCIEYNYSDDDDDDDDDDDVNSDDDSGDDDGVTLYDTNDIENDASIE
jgi:hypothetical protein